MPGLTDEQFVDAIFDRLRTHGWTTGRMGLYEGPNCLIGAAAFVAHNGALEMDPSGITPIAIDGEALAVNPENPEDDAYDAVPGITRLARITGLSSFALFYLNDRCKSAEDVEKALRREMALA